MRRRGETGPGGAGRGDPGWLNRDAEQSGSCLVGKAEKAVQCETVKKVEQQIRNVVLMLHKTREMMEMCIQLLRLECS